MKKKPMGFWKSAMLGLLCALIGFIAIRVGGIAFGSDDAEFDDCMADALKDLNDMIDYYTSEPGIKDDYRLEQINDAKETFKRDLDNCNEDIDECNNVLFDCN